MQKHILFLGLLLALTFSYGQKISCDSVRIENELLIHDLEKLVYMLDSISMEQGRLQSVIDSANWSKTGKPKKDQLPLNFEEYSSTAKAFMHLVHLPVKEGISFQAYQELLSKVKGYNFQTPITSNFYIGDPLQMGSKKNLGIKELLLQLSFEELDNFNLFLNSEKRKEVLRSLSPYLSSPPLEYNYTLD